MRKQKTYKDFKGDGPVIVLLHGFLSSSKYWTKLQPQLTKDGFRVVTIDLLGFGRAPKPRHSEYDYGAHMAHIDAALRQLNLIDQPITLIGHSMGALLASKYASEHQRRIASLILLHPPLYADMVEAKATLRDTGRFYRFLLDSKYRAFGWLRIKTFLRYRIGKHTKHSREKSLRNVIEVAEIFGDLESSTLQTLLLVGSKDRPEYANNIARRSLGANIKVVIEDVTHHSPVQNPLLVRTLVHDFLQK